jgi:hypothetical protein
MAEEKQTDKVPKDEIEEENYRKTLLENAVSSMSEESKNQILLQAVRHFKTIKNHRDALIVRVGELDTVFGDWILKKSEDDDAD